MILSPLVEDIPAAAVEEERILLRLPGAMYFSVKSRSQQEMGCNSNGSMEETLINGLSEV